MRACVGIVGALGIVVVLAQRADAGLWQLTVTYTSGEIVEGPLSMGLSELPDSVTATFLLEGTGLLPAFDAASVITATLPFGDGTLDQGDLHGFAVVTEEGDARGEIEITTLSYRMGGADPHLLPWIETIGLDAAGDPCVSRFPTTLCKIARNSNFELNLFALDAATEEFVHYRYLTSSQVLTQVVPEPSAAGLALVALPGLVIWRCRRRLAPRRVCGNWQPRHEGSGQ